MSGRNSISPQWALNETSDSVIGLAKGMLKAATSDNVQILAIMAAEGFGATIAICEQTQKAVELEAKRCHSSYTIKFLKAQIGYLKGDAADALAQSTGGIRFLCLAAALMTLGHFSAAQCVQQMITAAAREGQLLPPALHLRDLIAALEYKLLRTGFADQVLGWQIFFSESLTPHGSSSSPLELHDTMRPPVEAIQAMVKAFREVGRLGENTNIHITTYLAAPWIMAFVKWCFGVPPVVILSDGTVILDEPSSKVILRVVKPTESGRIEVKTFRDLSSPSTLWSMELLKDDIREWSGMVSIEMYAKRHLHKWYLSEKQQDLGYRALCQALKHSLRTVVSEIVSSGHKNMTPRDRAPINGSMNNSSDGFSNLIGTGGAIVNDSGFESTMFEDCDQMPREVRVEEIEGFNGDNLDELHSSIPAELRKYRGRLFMPDQQIEETLALFLDLDSSKCRLKSLEEGITIHDIPVVGTFTNKLRANCDCAHCGSEPTSIGDCELETFEQQISWLTALILAVSLFDCTEPIKMYINHHRTSQEWAVSPGPNSFVKAVHSIIFNEFHGDTVFTDILDLALWAIGHEAHDTLQKGTWIASADKGQVVYPNLFDSGVLVSSGLLRLGGGPGGLIFRGLRYAKVTAYNEGRDSLLYPTGTTWSHSTRLYPRVPVMGAINLLEEDIVSPRLLWQVTERERDLQIMFGVTSSCRIFNPLHVLGTAVQSIFVPRCAHSKDKELTSADNGAYYLIPFWECRRQILSTWAAMTWKACMNKTAVVAVAGSDALRFYSLVSNVPGVIRMNACLGCCLDICRQAGYPYVVC